MIENTSDKASRRSEVQLTAEGELRK